MLIASQTEIGDDSVLKESTDIHQNALAKVRRPAEGLTNKPSIEALLLFPEEYENSSSEFHTTYLTQ